MDIVLLGLAGLLVTSLATGYLLTVWFDGAKFFLEYIKIFNLQNRIPHIKTYLRLKDQGSPDSYLEYIESFQDTFLSRLVTCPKCLSFWLSLFLFGWYSLLTSVVTGVKLGMVLFLLSPIYALAASGLGILLYNKIK